MAGYNPAADLSPLANSAAQVGAGGGGGFHWSLNPLNDITQGVSALGDYINRKTSIGGFNPGIGSVVATIGNVVPGLANLGVHTVGGIVHGVTTGNFHPLENEARQVGTQFVHGVADTATDILTAGGLAPYTNALERFTSNNGDGYRPETLREYATHPGQGLGGAALNDFLNVATGASAGAKIAALGDVGTAALDAQAADRAAQLAKATEGGTPAEVSQAGADARLARATENAAHLSVQSGANPTELSMRVLGRARTLDRLQSVAQAGDAVFNAASPMKALRSFAKAGDINQAERLAGEQAPEEVPTSQATEGSHQAAGAPAAPAPVPESDAAVAQRELASLATATKPKGDVTFYRGQVVDENVPVNSDNWSLSRAEAEAHARASGGQVIETTVPHEVAVDALKSAQERGDFGTGGEPSTPEGATAKEAAAVNTNVGHLPPEYADQYRVSEQPAPAAEAKTEEATAQTGKATWHNGDTDKPITVEGSLGRAADGREYLKVEGSKTGVPADEVTFEKPTVPGIGPKEMRNRLLEAKPVAARVQRIVNALPKWAQDFLASQHQKMQGRDVRVARAERNQTYRMEQIREWSQPYMRRLGAVADTLVGKVMDDGTKISPELADQIVSERVGAALTNGPAYDQLESNRAEIDAHSPGATDRMLGFNAKLPAELNTPEFRDQVHAIAALYDQRGQELHASVDIESAMDDRQKDAEGLMRVARGQQSVVDLQRELASSALTTKLRISALNDTGDKFSRVVERSLRDATVPSVPPVWQPLLRTTIRMANELRDNPELEPLLTEFPKNFGQAVRYAMDNENFEPGYLTEMSDGQVRNLALSSVPRLGPMQKAGTLETAIVKKTRSGRLASANLISVNSARLAAGMLSVTHEQLNNGLVQLIDSAIARSVITGTDGHRYIPPLSGGAVAWDETRQMMLSKPDVPAGAERAIQATQYIPRPVDKVLRRYMQDYSNPMAEALKKITDPWRALVLTASPKFYVNHVLGHIMLATIQGVRLGDWANAWAAAKKDESGLRFATIPELRQQSLTQAELGPSTIAQYPNVREAMSGGGLQAAWREVKSKVQAATNTADSFARSAVYFKTLRTTGSRDTALHFAEHALVDYQDLSSFERNVVRAVVPFYSFEKGVLKIVMQYPLDHPVAANLLMAIGRTNQQDWELDANGNPLPEAYQSTVRIGGMNINAKSLSPFKDVAALTTPDGIVSSLQFAIQAVVRSGLNQPAPGSKVGVKVGPTGDLVPNVTVGGQLASTLTETPQGSLLSGLTGGSTKTPGQAALSFFGLPTVSSSTLEKAGQRLQLSQGETTLPTATIQKAVTGPVDQQQLMQALAKATPGTGIQPSDVFAQSAQPNQQQVSAAQDQLHAQAVKAAATRAANGTNRRSSTRRSSGGGGGGIHITHHGSSLHSFRSHRSRTVRVKLRRAFASGSRHSSAPRFHFKSSTKGVPGLKKFGA